MNPRTSTRGPDAGTLLRRAIERNAEAGGCDVAVEAVDMVHWASATFVGARHRLTLRGHSGAALDAWLACLPEADLPLRRHLVADVIVSSVAHRDGVATCEIEALTVEE